MTKSTSKSKHKSKAAANPISVGRFMRLRRNPRTWQLATVAVAIAAVGAVMAVSSRASVSTVSYEIESGTISKPAQKVAIKNASHGLAVQLRRASSKSQSSGSSSSSNGSNTSQQSSGSSTTQKKGRTYPLHTKINATTFWVGEDFQSTSDGSQVCSAYNSQWQYSYFHLKTGTDHSQGCNGAPTGGCDARRSNASGKCDDSNSIGSLRTPANGYFPAGIPKIYENPFYLDLPYDDYNQTDSTDTTGFSSRCKDIPWANDAGYAGHCTDKGFSYMKNRWVKIMANGKTCYGQVEDAGPADDGHGNGNYADANYVFSTKDARPYNKSYNSAGMDVSPALNSCLGGTFNKDLMVNWQFVNQVDVPSKPWKTIVTSSPPS